MSAYLAIDTATDAGSVAVGAPGAIAAEVVMEKRHHASALIPGVQEALRLGGVSFTEIRGILIADGPGSFTGLRIGFASAQGLVRERPDVPVMVAPSLLSTAYLDIRRAEGGGATVYGSPPAGVF